LLLVPSLLAPTENNCLVNRAHPELHALMLCRTSMPRATNYGTRISWQPFIDWAWDAFDFDKVDWDEGFGYDDVWKNNGAHRELPPE
jgi:hypothetical protein